MKTQSKVLALLLLFTFVFVSCSSDDDPKEKKTFSATCKHEVVLRALKDNSNTTTYDAKKLEDMLPVSIYDYTPPIIQGELIPIETSVKITGLKEGTILKNFSLTINGLNYNKWDDIKVTNNFDNTELVTSSSMSYFTNVFNQMIVKRELKITVSYTPNQDLLDNDVKLEVNFGGRYTYWQKK